MIYHDDPQGSDAWLASRKGCITGSRFKDARDKLKSGAPSGKALAYARDVARERCGGAAPGAYQTKAMREGTEQEPLARMAYEALTGELVDEVGFITDDDAIFGLSLDGRIGEKGAIEIKTMVSSETLFRAVADGDISDYMDQCMGALWLLGLDWIDLVLWAPDLEPLGLHITIIRIHRDETAIEALEADLLAFAALVRENEEKLRMAAEKLKPKEEIEIMEQITEIVQIAPPEMPLLADILAAVAPTEIVQLFAVPENETAGEVVGAEVFLAPMLASDDPKKAQDSPPTLTLGAISKRLSFAVTAEFLRTLGFEPAGRCKAAILFHESSWPLIKAALIRHITQLA